MAGTDRAGMRAWMASCIPAKLLTNRKPWMTMRRRTETPSMTADTVCREYGGTMHPPIPISAHRKTLSRDIRLDNPAHILPSQRDNPRCAIYIRPVEVRLVAPAFPPLPVLQFHRYHSIPQVGASLLHFKSAGRTCSLREA